MTERKREKDEKTRKRGRERGIEKRESLKRDENKS